ncbi:hypothetical protein RFI_12992, partial [Reticulomyxa filosa]
MYVYHEKKKYNNKMKDLFYLKGLINPWLGIKKAHQLISSRGTYQKVIQQLRFEGKAKIPNDYAGRFQKAKWTFYHQTVYDKDLKQLVHLNPLPAELQNQDISFLGPYVYVCVCVYLLSLDFVWYIYITTQIIDNNKKMFEHEIAQKIAEGVMDPISKCPFEDKSSDLHLSVQGNLQNNGMLTTLAQHYGPMKNMKPRQTNFKPKYKHKPKDKPQQNTLFNYCIRKTNDGLAKSMTELSPNQEKKNKHNSNENVCSGQLPPFSGTRTEHPESLRQLKANTETVNTDNNSNQIDKSIISTETKSLDKYSNLVIYVYMLCIRMNFNFAKKKKKKK